MSVPSPYAPPSAASIEAASSSRVARRPLALASDPEHCQALRSVSGLILFSAGLYLVPFWRAFAAWLDGSGAQEAFLDSLAGCTLAAFATGLFAAPLVLALICATCERVAMMPATLTAELPVFACALLVVSAIACARLGHGIVRLQGWTRGPVCALAGLGLLQPPIGTLVYCYVLWLFAWNRTSAVAEPATD